MNILRWCNYHSIDILVIAILLAILFLMTACANTTHITPDGKGGYSVCYSQKVLEDIPGIGCAQK